MKIKVLILFPMIALLLFSSATYATDWFRIGAMESAYRETNTQDVEIAFNILLDEIMAQYDEASVIKTYNDFNVMLNDMKKGELDACMGTSLEMYDHLDEFHSDYYYAFTNNNTSVNEYYVVAQKKYASVDQLKGRVLGLSKNSGVGRLFLDVYLLENVHRTHKGYFGEINYEPNSHTALVNLIFGKHDVVMVSKNGFEVANSLNPSISKEVIIIGRSEPYLASFIGVSKAFPKDRLERLTKMALNLHKSEKGRHLLNTFHFDRFIKVNQEDLDTVVQLRKDYRGLVKLYVAR